MAWVLAQTLKVAIDSIRRRRLDVRLMASAGGMPSSHTTMVVALSTVLARDRGPADPLFAASLIFSMVVMYDAAGVRRAAGRQAAALNRIIDDLFVGRGIREEPLRELIGHTPVQVLAGALLGIAMGLIPL
jgi:acid phosphatase family membrane protein YuiD